VAARWLPLAPRVRHGLLAVGLVKFALPPMLAFPTGLFSSVPPIDRAPFGALEIPAGASAGVMVVVGIYAAGCLIAAMRALFAARGLSRICSRAQPVSDSRALQLLAESRQNLRIRREVLLLESEAITVPFATGWLRPRVFLPESLTATRDELRSVLAHELAHIRRHDIALRWLGTILNMVWWFHPLLPTLQRRMRTASEECCDDLAVSVQGVTISAYRRALVMVAELASRRKYEWATAMSDETETLRDRIARLATPPSRRIARWQVILVMALAALLLPGVRITAGRLVPRIEIRQVEAGSVSDDHQTRHAARHQHHH